MKGKGERERYTQLNAEFQRIAKRDEKDKWTMQRNKGKQRVEKTRNFFKKTGIPREHFIQRWA